MVAWCWGWCCVAVVQQVLQDTTRRLLEDLDSSGDSMIEFGEFKKHKKVRNSGGSSTAFTGMVYDVDRGAVVMYVQLIDRAVVDLREYTTVLLSNDKDHNRERAPTPTGQQRRSLDGMLS